MIQGQPQVLIVEPLRGTAPGGGNGFFEPDSCETSSVARSDNEWLLQGKTRLLRLPELEWKQQISRAAVLSAGRRPFTTRESCLQPIPVQRVRLFSKRAT